MGSGAPAVTPTNLDRPFLSGYHAYWAEDAWKDHPLDALDELFFFEVEVAADGHVLDTHGWPDGWRALVDRAVEEGVQVVPTVSMHDARAFEALFSDARRTERLVETLLDLIVSSPEISGLHLDMEVFQPVPLDVRDGYTAFVARLAEAMRSRHPRLSLSVFVLAFDDDDAYNERALGQIADFVVVQGYDYHSRGSANAGPVAAVAGWGRLNWETVLRRFDELGVPRDKMVMGVPLYGYEWPVHSSEPGAKTRGPGVIVPLTAPEGVRPELPRALSRAQEHGTHRDAVSGSPYYVYRTDEGWWQGWYEDEESLRRKYAFVQENGLGGIALFPLAYGTEALWEQIRRTFARSR